MFFFSIIVNAIAILFGVLAGVFTKYTLPEKVQNRLCTFVAAFLLYVAIRIGFYEFLGGIEQRGLGSLLFSLFMTWVCLVLSAMLFRKSPLPKLIQSLTRKAQSGFTTGRETVLVSSLRVGVSFFALTPLSFAGAALLGGYGAPHLLLAKSVIDLLGAFSIARMVSGLRSRLLCAIGMSLPTLVLQVFLIILFVKAKAIPTNIASGLPCVGFVVLYLCLHTSLVLLKWNKSGSLFSYVPALFLALFWECIH